MSNLIRSSRIVLDDATFKLKSNITIPNEEYIQKVESSELGTPIESTVLVQKASEMAKNIYDGAIEKAQEVLESSRLEALEIENSALAKSEEIYANAKQEGYDQGYEQGYSTGYEEAKQKSYELIEEASNQKQMVMEQKRRILSDCEAELTNLSIAIASKILNLEISNNQYIREIIQQGMSKLMTPKDVVIRVSEKDYDFAMYLKPQIFLMTKNIDNIEIKMDLSLEKGDCIIETATGSIDVGLSTQLERIREEFQLAFRE